MEDPTINVAASAGEVEGPKRRALLGKCILASFVVSAFVVVCCESGVGTSVFSHGDDGELSTAGVDLPAFMKEREAIFWGDCDYDPLIPDYGPENLCAGLNAAFIWGGHSTWAFEELYKKDLDLMFGEGSWTEYKLNENPTLTLEELQQYEVIYVEDPYRNGFEVATWLEGDGADLLESVAELGVALFVNIYTFRSRPIPLPYGAKLERPSPFAVSMTFPQPIQNNELYKGEFQDIEETYSGWAAAFAIYDYPRWLRPLTVNAKVPDQALSVGGRTRLGNRVLLSGMNHPLYWGDTPEAFHLRANMFQYVCDNGGQELDSESDIPSAAPTKSPIPSAATISDVPTAAPTCAWEPAWMHCPDRSQCFGTMPDRDYKVLGGWTNEFDQLVDPTGCVLLAEVGDQCVFRGDNMPVVANIDVVTQDGSELRFFNFRPGYAIAEVYFWYNKEALPSSDIAGKPTTDMDFFTQGVIEAGPRSVLIVDYPGKNFNERRKLTVQAKVCRV